MATLHIRYPGVFSPTFGLIRFEVYLDQTLVMKLRGYRRRSEHQVDSEVGNHNIEIRTISNLSGARHSSFFNINVPSEGTYVLLLDASPLWGIWKQPKLKHGN